MLSSKKLNVQKRAKRLVFRKGKASHNHTPLIVNGENSEIICILQACGKTHGFTLINDEFIGIDASVKLLADNGYQGVAEFYANSQTPYKRVNTICLQMNKTALTAIFQGSELLS